MKKVKIAANPIINYGMVILIVFAILFDMWMFVYATDVALVITLLMVLPAMIIFMFALSTLGVTLTLTEKGIIYRRLFHKRIIKEYSKYPYVYRSSYWHGTPIGIGNRVYFIILSEHRYSDKQLEDPSSIPITDETIKIVYSKKTLKTLNDIVPPKLAVRLNNMFGDLC